MKTYKINGDLSDKIDITVVQDDVLSSGQTMRADIFNQFGDRILSLEEDVTGDAQMTRTDTTHLVIAILPSVVATMRPGAYSLNFCVHSSDGSFAVNTESEAMFYLKQIGR